MESPGNCQSHILQYPPFSAFIARDFAGANGPGALTGRNVFLQESGAWLPRCRCLYCVWGMAGIIPPMPFSSQPQYNYSSLSFPAGYPSTDAQPPCCPPERHGQKMKNTAMEPQTKMTGKQRPVCIICDKRFARVSTLKIHLRIHSGEKPYKCAHCPKSFAQSANLVAHVRTHTGEKPYKCHICQKRFSQSSSVTTHIRTHTGVRPFRCSQCGKCFSDRSTLSKHGRVHQKMKTTCVIEGEGLYKAVKTEWGTVDLHVASRD